MRIRRKATALVAGSACLVAAGCGGGGGGGSSSSGSLTWFMWSGSQQEVSAWKHVAALVTQRYPKIHVKFTTTSFADYFTKLKTEAASSTLPCIISLQSQRASGFGDLFQPLNPLMSKSGFDKSAFDNTIMAGLTTKGAQRAIPYDYGPYLLYYNATMFKKAGVPLPTPNWTMSQFNSDLQKLTKSGVKAYSAFPYPDDWLPWAVNSGAQYINSSGKLDLTNPQVVKAFTWYSDLVHKYHYAPQPPSTSDVTWPTTQFQGGNMALAIDGPWDLINTKQSANFKVGLAPLPKQNGKSTTLVAGSGFGIAKTCQDQSAAWKAIQIMTGPKAEQYLAEQGRAFPARTAQQTYWYKNAVPGAKPALDAALKDAQPFRTTPTWDQVSQLLTQYGVPALNGAKSPASVLQTVQSQAGS